MAEERKSQSTRDGILDAAIELFITDGFETTPMDAIAVAAKVAKGTLYYHFKSKEGIVEAIIERYVVSVTEAFSLIEADTAKATLEKFGAMMEAMEDINIATFSKLHHMKYIDIHDKTSIAMVQCLAPFFGRLIEEGNASGLWNVAYPLEFAEITIAASSSLFDPERGVERYERRLAAFIDVCAKVLGMTPEALAPTMKSLSHYVAASPGPAAE